MTMWRQDQEYFHVSMPVAGNYYPLASPGAIRIKSETGNAALALVTDRAHGAASLDNGQIEIMIGRQLGLGFGLENGKLE